jgi:hypothetical protein
MIALLAMNVSPQEQLLDGGEPGAISKAQGSSSFALDCMH